MGIQTFFANADRQREVQFQLRLTSAFERRLIPELARAINNRARLAAQGFRDAQELGVDMALAGHEDELTDLLATYYRQVMASFGGRILDAGKAYAPLETKRAPDIFAARVNTWIEELAPTRAIGIAQTTAEKIKEALKDGTSEGGGIDEIARRIVDDAGGLRPGSLPFKRAQVIARTEIHTASIAAQDEALTSMGLDEIKREWVAVEDGRTRESHRQADGQTRKQDEFFDIGGAKLKAPGDPRAPAEEIVNCRCVLVGVIEE